MTGIITVIPSGVLSARARIFAGRQVSQPSSLFPRAVISRFHAMTHGFSGRAICSSHRRCIVDRMIASIESSIVLGEENFMSSRLPSDDDARSCDAVSSRLDE